MGLIAFCGGVDIYYDRIVASYNGYCQPGGSGSSLGAPYHDVHCRIVGPAAVDLLQIFKERWNNHPDVSGKSYTDIDGKIRPSDELKERIPVGKRVLSGEKVSESKAPDGSHVYVQIGRTYGNGKNHGGNVRDGFPFAPNGERTAKGMILHAIKQAKNLIYMEDQYLVNTDASTALRDALKANEKLQVVILVPDNSITELTDCRAKRNEFLKILEAFYKPHAPTSPSNRVAVCALKRPTGQASSQQRYTYVHSKIYLIDDKFAIIGSANCNQRSWTNDSEVVAGIYDESDDKERTIHFAHHLRLRIWAQYLNKGEHECFDIGSTVHWFHPPTDARIEVFNRNTLEAGGKHELVPWEVAYPNGS